MNIRLAREEDLETMNVIYNQAVRLRYATAHLDPLDMDYRRAWFRVHDPERFPVFVSEQEGRVLGWISLSPYREGRQAFSHVAELSYYVEVQNTGKGIGSALLQYAIQQAPVFHFSVLVALLLATNNNSISLLTKFGFRPWGVMPGVAVIDGRETDHLYYGLKLKERV